MANPEHLKIIKQGVKAWNKWREENPDIWPDLEKVNLIGAKLEEANLKGANLKGANLTGAQLRDAILIGATLSGANLTGVNLSRANLIGAKLRRADLFGANLLKAKLRRADLFGANLIETNLAKADLIEASLYGANLNGANLQVAVLLETNLSNVNLSNAKNLNSCIHYSPSTLDHRTLIKSGNLPEVFLRGCGLPESLIEYYPSLLNQPLNFYSCFISYSHADKSFARRLHDALQGKGIRCWLDEHQLLPGQDIHDEVDRGIRLWDKLLLCASENSLTSWWVDKEINTAFEKEIELTKEQGSKIRALVPLNLDGYLFSGEWKSGKATEVKSRVAADFTGWETDNQKFEDAFDRLVKSIQETEGREPPPISKL